MTPTFSGTAEHLVTRSRSANLLASSWKVSRTADNGDECHQSNSPSPAFFLTDYNSDHHFLPVDTGTRVSIIPLERKNK